VLIPLIDARQRLGGNASVAMCTHETIEVLFSVGRKENRQLVLPRTPCLVYVSCKKMEF
jgi:hypothetical protein